MNELRSGSLSLKLKHSLKLIANLKNLENLSSLLAAPDLSTCESQQEEDTPRSFSWPEQRHFLILQKKTHVKLVFLNHGVKMSLIYP